MQVYWCHIELIFTQFNSDRTEYFKNIKTLFGIVSEEALPKQAAKMN